VSDVARASLVRRELSGSPFFCRYLYANSPLRSTLSCSWFVTLSEGVHSSHFAIARVGVLMLKFGKSRLISARPGYCRWLPPIWNDAGPNCCWYATRL